MTLADIKQVALPACREFKVKRLDLFGSLARGEETTTSDVDLLVEFEEPELHPSRRFFGLQGIASSHVDRRGDRIRGLLASVCADRLIRSGRVHDRRHTQSGETAYTMKNKR